MNCTHENTIEHRIEQFRVHERLAKSISTLDVTRSSFPTDPEKGGNWMMCLCERTNPTEKLPGCFVYVAYRELYHKTIYADSFTHKHMCTITDDHTYTNIHPTAPTNTHSHAHLQTRTHTLTRTDTNQHKHTHTQQTQTRHAHCTFLIIQITVTTGHSNIELLTFTEWTTSSKQWLKRHLTSRSSLNR